MPVLLPGRRDDRVACSHRQHGLAPGLDVGQAIDDVQHLAARVLMPVRVRAGLETDEAGPRLVGRAQQRALQGMAMELAFRRRGLATDPVSRPYYPPSSLLRSKKGAAELPPF